MSDFKQIGIFISFLFMLVGGAPTQAAAEQRIALVIGQGAYQTGALPTAANDAGLVAQTLTSAGFEVVQGRDLVSSDLRLIVRDFLDKVQAAEDDAAVVVYLAGHGVQFEGENYIVPVDARITRDVDVPLEAFRLSDIVRSLSAVPGRVRIIVADMNRPFPWTSTGPPIAQGLALVEPPEGFLLAFSSSPNIPALDEPGPYGAYATALVERMREPGLAPEEIFAQVRLRTHEASEGLQTPWHASNLGGTNFVFFEAAEPAAVAERRPRAPREIEALPAEEAYAVAVERDTIQDYQTFLRRYPDHRLARRVAGLIAARREAIVWQKTILRDTREAYWTYARRYPSGPHLADARRRLIRLAAPIEAPIVFEEVIYEDLPPPLPIVERIEVVDIVTIIREAPPPPPPPIYLLPARDYDDELIVTLVSAAPPPSPMPGILPIPRPIPIPVRARPPVAFYQPVAPITPRGPVAIPVAPPPVQFVPAVAPGAPPRPARPVAPVPTVADQPGLTAPVQPLPIAAAPTAPVPGRAGGRSGATPPLAPRIPLRPIPLLGPTPGEPPRPAGTTAQPAVPGSSRSSPGGPAAPPIGSGLAPTGRATPDQPARDPSRPPIPGTALDPTAPRTSIVPGASDARPGGDESRPRARSPQNPDAVPQGVVPPAAPGTDQRPLGRGGPDRTRPADESLARPRPQLERPTDIDDAPRRGRPPEIPAHRGFDRQSAPPLAPRAAPPVDAGPLRPFDPRTERPGRSVPDATPGLERAAPERPRLTPPSEPPQRRRLQPDIERTPELVPAERPRFRPEFERIDRPSPTLERSRPAPRFERPPEEPTAPMERSRPQPEFERPSIGRSGPAIERLRPPPQLDRAPVERPSMERPGTAPERVRPPPQFERPIGEPPAGALQRRPEGPPPGAEPQQRRGRSQGCPPGEACPPGQIR